MSIFETSLTCNINISHGCYASWLDQVYHMICRFFIWSRTNPVHVWTFWEGVWLSLTTSYNNFLSSLSSESPLQASSPGTGTVFMIGETDSFIVGLYLEGFFFGKRFYSYSCLSSQIIPPWRSRHLYRNIRLVFELRMEKVQGGSHSLRSLSSLRPICYYLGRRCYKISVFSKQRHFYLSEYHFLSIVLGSFTTTSSSNSLTA